MIRNNLFKTDNLLWQFEELIKTLITMSVPFDSQKEFYGIGVTSDEILENFYSYYALGINLTLFQKVAVH